MFIISIPMSWHPMNMTTLQLYVHINDYNNAEMDYFMNIIQLSKILC